MEKRNIFIDNTDYEVFLSYLKTYLEPKDEEKLQTLLADPDTTWVKKNILIKQLRLNNFTGEINLLAYCLMPNHFHLLVKQEKPDSIDRFINSLGTRYVMYFNRKYNRVGPLYQGVYKAVTVETESQLVHLSAYIHKNPFLNSIPLGEALEKQPSSLPEYLGSRKSHWVKSEEILNFFSKTNNILSYKTFVLKNRFSSESVRKLILE